MQIIKQNVLNVNQDKLIYLADSIVASALKLVLLMMLHRYVCWKCMHVLLEMQLLLYAGVPHPPTTHCNTDHDLGLKASTITVKPAELSCLVFSCASGPFLQFSKPKVSARYHEELTARIETLVFFL